jgi:S1-C subfamily serine protease
MQSNEYHDEVSKETINRIIDDHTRRTFLSSLPPAVATTMLIRNRPGNAYDSDDARRISIFERVSPSVVFIDTFAERRDTFTTNVLEVPLGSGSGFVWDKQGHIVTNFHVVRNANTAQVAILLSGIAANKASELSEEINVASSSSSITTKSTKFYTSNRTKPTDGMIRKVFTARIVGVDPGKDIAVLKIDANEAWLYPIAIGSSKNIKVGQSALAIGNPFGLDHTLTAGIISGTGREVKSPIGRPITNVLQTDAAVNPGNSGGPLLDSNGDLIGMNTAIFSPSGASAGIGFAIPVDTVKSIVDTLIREGRVVRSVLGISILGSKQARTLGITSGVLVLEISPGSPLKGTRRTETGLIELGDVIVKINDTPIETEADLFQAIESYLPGAVVTVTVNRVVAIQDELVLQELELKVPLQSSTQFEKNLAPQPQSYALPSVP